MKQPIQLGPITTVSGQKTKFSEEVCYCGDTCCSRIDTPYWDVTVPEYEIWKCVACECHYNFEDHPLYEEFVHSRYGKLDD